MKPSYTISEDHRSITCLICGGISNHPQDVQNHFCGACHVWHDDLQACAWCDEAVAPGEQYRSIPHIEEGHRTVRDWHWECSLRAIVGGLNHQMGKCSCCGGTQPPDPPEMSTRQAALAAVEYFYLTEKRHPCQHYTDVVPRETPRP